MTRYLLTGGAGFIGSHLAERLLDDGDELVVLDDLSTGRVENVAHLLGRRGFELVVGSAADAALTDRLTRGCDAVVHLAAEAAARHGRPALVASSSEVYGYRAAVPMREDADRVLGAAGDPRSTYAAAKLHDECLVASYARERGLPFVAVRLFNTTGPRQRADTGMVLPRFASLALSERPLPVFGDGRQTRCFAHVDDVVEALQALLARTDLRGEVFNVGSTDEVSLLALARMVAAAAGSPAPVQLVPYPEGYEEPRRRVPDIAKIRAAVGWTPSRGLEQIVADVIGAHRPLVAA
jgi:UDP-glucose 4-epimerase